MAWAPKIMDTVKSMLVISRDLRDSFIDREDAIYLLMLATVCQEHLLLVGPPGTAKTQLINNYTELLDLSGFNYLLTRFSEPSELFGPIDLAAFQRGDYHIRTEGMLPEAQIVFLDEIFQGSSAILNSLLTILNERTFNNGAQRQRVPLVSMIGATNALPQDPSLQAFADRFLLRVEVNPVEEDRLDDLIELGWDLELSRIRANVAQLTGKGTPIRLAKVKHEQVLSLHERLTEVDMSRVRPEYSRLIRELRAEGVEISDRRAVRGMKLISGAALLRGDDVADVQDFRPLLYLWNRSEEADVIRAVVTPRLTEAGVALNERKRAVEDIVLDLRTVESQAPAVRSEAALSAHLMTLNKLRRELINDHPKELEARKLAEQIIQQALEYIGGVPS